VSQVSVERIPRRVAPAALALLSLALGAIARRMTDDTTIFWAEFCQGGWRFAKQSGSVASWSRKPSPGTNLANEGVAN
jgi:hypothetical protein